MSQAEERMYWWDFKSTAEDKAYLKGFEDALEWALSMKELGCKVGTRWEVEEVILADIIKKELENE